MKVIAQRIEQRPLPAVERREARREGAPALAAVTGGAAQRSARLGADSFTTTDRAQPRPEPATPQPAPAPPQKKKSGGGIGGFFRGIGRAIGGAARTVGRAVG